MPYKNREDYLAWKKRYYKAHKDKWDKYRKEHREHIREYNRQRYIEKHDEILEQKRKWDQENREKKREYYKRYSTSEKGRTRKKEYYEEHKQEFFARAKKSMAKYPTERKVRSKTDHAISSGKLVRQPCEICGDPKTDAHHDDYNKPLEVRWLCRSCHKKWHDNNKPIRSSEEWSPERS